MVQAQHITNTVPPPVSFKVGRTLPEIITPRSSSVLVTLYASRVQAGFPSPADDYVEKTLDLNEHLISHPASTFFVRVAGDSMTRAGIHHNDIFVVDRSIQAADWVCSN